MGNEFDKHCRDIYSLSNEEIDYIYLKYSRKLRELKPPTIKDKIKNNG